MNIFQKLALPASLALTLALAPAAYAGPDNPDKNGEDGEKPSKPEKPDKNGEDDGHKPDKPDRHYNNGNGRGNDGDGALKCRIGKRIIYVITRDQCDYYLDRAHKKGGHDGQGNAGYGRYGQGHGDGLKTYRHGNVVLVPTSRAAAMQIDKRYRKWLKSQGIDDSYAGHSQAGKRHRVRASAGAATCNCDTAGTVVLHRRQHVNYGHPTVNYGDVRVSKRYTKKRRVKACKDGIDKNGGF